jgi:hypothetical protein
MRRLLCTVFDGATMSAEVLEDFVELDPFAAAVHKHPRTVMRWCQKDGLPYTRNGRTVLIHIPTYREWLLGRMKNMHRKRPPARRSVA